MYSCFLILFNDPATTEIYPLSLHDALPIYQPHLLGGGDRRQRQGDPHRRRLRGTPHGGHPPGLVVRPPLRKHRDRKSTRPNSSHSQISYAAFCLEKKKDDYVSSAQINVAKP